MSWLPRKRRAARGRASSTCIHSGTDTSMPALVPIPGRALVWERGWVCAGLALWVSLTPCTSRGSALSYSWLWRRHCSQTAGNSSQSWCSLSHALWLEGWTAQSFCPYCPRYWLMVAELEHVGGMHSAPIPGAAGGVGRDPTVPSPRRPGELRPWPQARRLTGIALGFPIQTSSPRHWHSPS